ncbi:MAG: type II secretion system protein [Candidatus Thiodiazotropha sp. 6PLUC2]
MFINSSRQKGFSLLEVLVAFTLLALTLGVMMKTLSSNSRGLVIASQHSQAATLAESLISEVGVTEPLQVSSLEGQSEDGYHWHLNVEENPMENGYLKGASFIVTAEISWGEVGSGRRYVLSTLRY